METFMEKFNSIRKDLSMYLVKIALLSATAALLLSNAAFGEIDSTIKLEAHGHGYMDAGQIVKGFDKNVGDIKNVWTERIISGFGLNVTFNPQTEFMTEAEVNTYNEFPRIVTQGASRRFYYYFYMMQAELRHKLLEGTGINLDVGGGYFPYKYDSDVRNLGEYLFRSTAYPQILQTDFDFPKSRLFGLYAKSSYTHGINKFTLDLLATTNTEWIAIHDLNLSLVASYNLAHAFELGAGVSFCSLLSADESATTPKNDATAYLNGNDTAYYTFRGTKLMARFAFDPKRLFSSSAFGAEDLKLYGEAALLGVKNYPTALNSPIWYMSRLERIPAMLGFNLPVFKMLDVLSLEGEWWGNRYPNSMEGIVTDGLPIPFIPGTQTIDSTKYKNDNIKWSIYGSKIFGKHYRISFQAANDHMRTFAWDWSRQDWEESLHAPDCWYYVLRFGILFNE
jgi:hypothetical protein